MPTWETLEEFVRTKIQTTMQSVLEEELTAFLGRGKSERRSDVDPAPGYRNGHGKRRRLALSLRRWNLARGTEGDPLRDRRPCGHGLAAPTAPAILSLIDASASMNRFTVEPVPTPTIAPGCTYLRAAWPTSALSSSWVICDNPWLLLA